MSNNIPDKNILQSVGLGPGDSIEIPGFDQVVDIHIFNPESVDLQVIVRQQQSDQWFPIDQVINATTTYTCLWLAGYVYAVRQLTAGATTPPRVYVERVQTHQMRNIFYRSGFKDVPAFLGGTGGTVSGGSQIATVPTRPETAKTTPPTHLTATFVISPHTDGTVTYWERPDTSSPFTPAGSTDETVGAYVLTGTRTTDTRGDEPTAAEITAALAAINVDGPPEEGWSFLQELSDRTIERWSFDGTNWSLVQTQEPIVNPDWLPITSATTELTKGDYSIGKVADLPDGTVSLPVNLEVGEHFEIHDPRGRSPAVEVDYDLSAYTGTLIARDVNTNTVVTVNLPTDGVLEKAGFNRTFGMMKLARESATDFVAWVSVDGTGGGSVNGGVALSTVQALIDAADDKVRTITLPLPAPDDTAFEFVNTPSEAKLQALVDSKGWTAESFVLITPSTVEYNFLNRADAVTGVKSVRLQSSDGNGYLVKTPILLADPQIDPSTVAPFDFNTRVGPVFHFREPLGLMVVEDVAGTHQWVPAPQDVAYRAQSAAQSTLLPQFNAAEPYVKSVGPAGALTTLGTTVVASDGRLYLASSDLTKGSAVDLTQDPVGNGGMDWLSTDKELRTIDEVSRHPFREESVYLSLGDQSGLFEWSSENELQRVNLDTWRSQIIPGYGDDGSGGAWVRSSIKDGVISIRHADLVGEGAGTSQFDWAEAEIFIRQMTRLRPGVTVQLRQGVYERDGVHPFRYMESGKVLGVMGKNTTVRQVGAVTTRPLLSVLEDSDNHCAMDIVFDGNDLVQGAPLFRSLGVQGFHHENIDYVKWDRAAEIKSSAGAAGRASTDLYMKNVRAIDASTVRNGYPFDIGGDWPSYQMRNITMIDCSVKGLGLPWQGITTPGNGDCFALKNIRGGKFVRLRAEGGGEIGIAPSRYSVDLQFIDCDTIGNDADGFGIGNGQWVVSTSAFASFTEGETVDFQNGASGTIEAIFDSKLYVSGVNYQSATEEMMDGHSVTGQTSGAVVTDTTFEAGAERIWVRGGKHAGNGIDGNATGLIYAGAKMIQARDVSFTDVDVSGDSVQTNGLYVVSSERFAYQGVDDTNSNIVFAGLGGTRKVLKGAYPSNSAIMLPINGFTDLDAAGVLTVNSEYTRYVLRPDVAGTPQTITEIIDLPQDLEIRLSINADSNSIALSEAGYTGAGSLHLSGGADAVLDDRNKVICLSKHPTLNRIIENWRNF